MTENTRQCALCESMRPESKMHRDGSIWVCRDQEICEKGCQVRDEAAKTDYPYDYHKDSWTGKNRRT